MKVESKLTCVENYSTIEKLNILFFGNSGLGKSSIIENVYNFHSTNSSTELQPIYEDGKRIVREYGETNQKTKNFTKYSIDKLHFFDTKGWNPTAENYTVEQFSSMLHGKCPIGFEIHSSQSVKVSHLESFLNKIDTVVFVNDATHTSEKELTQLIPYVKVCKELHIDTVFVVTKVDEISELKQVKTLNTNEAIKKIENCDKVKEVKRIIKTTFGLTENPLVLINYNVDENYKDELVEKLIGTFLKRCLQQSKLSAPTQSNSTVVKSIPWPQFDPFAGETKVIGAFVHSK